MRLHTTGVILLGALIAGCAPQEGEPDPQPSGPSDSSPSPEPTAEEAALQAYESMWDVVVEASHEGESDPPELEQYATGEVLALMRQTLEGAAEDEADVRGEPVLNPEVVEVSPQDNPDTVALLDCLDGSEWVEQDGADPQGEEGSSSNRQVDAAVNSDGLSWRVSELRIWEPGTC
ncbi:hypothetical protein [Nocardiopsis dassonvillei]|uniref:hypothetical protein n=1 Tax=Nocardiopsis dassonvillei TaxID=2014 RepID=UPI0003652F03|nr:hypothetical protein [Nocardiopsis dassonvillei]MCK9872408.1 hypothetical protein [Nocardiopsis dassonvillei]